MKLCSFDDQRLFTELRSDAAAESVSRVPDVQHPPLFPYNDPRRKSQGDYPISSRGLKAHLPASIDTHSPRTSQRKYTRDARDPDSPLDTNMKSRGVGAHTLHHEHLRRTLSPFWLLVCHNLTATTHPSHTTHR